MKRIYLSLFFLSSLYAQKRDPFGYADGYHKSVCTAIGSSNTAFFAQLYYDGFYYWVCTGDTIGNARVTRISSAGITLKDEQGIFHTIFFINKIAQKKALQLGKAEGLGG